MPRLRRSDPSRSGLSRCRRGSGFSYRDLNGRTITDPDQIRRLRDLAIPPAWQQVWICPWSNGHIQAIGTDAAGRRQYLYHPVWREQRDRAKHDRILDFAQRLPAVRERLSADLARRGLVAERVLSAGVRLLDLGFFRIGGDAYAEENGSYGMATLLREHVSVRRGRVMFDYVAKGGQQRSQAMAEPAVTAVVRALLRRSDPDPHLFAYRCGRHWRRVRSDDVNAYLHEICGTEFTAKDFRTWAATVLMAVALAVSEPTVASRTARDRAIRRGYAEVADYLGNTPAVARSSYVDSRVVDLFRDGVTISGVLEELGADTGDGELAVQGAIEIAVHDLIRGCNSD